VGTRVRNTKPKPPEEKTLADRCAEIIGSWVFIGSQATALALWIVFNGTLLVKADPYPFILLNLLLSTQAAFTGPILLMASNRQSQIDRKRDVAHYELDVQEKETIHHMASDLESLAKRLEDKEDNEHF
jgi:uncharacterized membrane protein